MSDQAFSVVVVGAGMSGLCTAVKLREQGINFVILERESGLGGTWYNNIYPGSGCDVPSHLYSYSFERKSDWSREYGHQSEILKYFEEAASKYELLPHIRFGVEVKSMRFNEPGGLWQLTCTDGEVVEGNAIVCGVGQLNRPHTPDIAGRDSFAGASFHSANWDYSLGLAGKRVACIGTGASAIQYIPEIASKVAQLDVYQRTPNWVIPKPDAEISGLRKKLYRYLPLYGWFKRLFIYLLLEGRFPAFRKEGAFNRMFFNNALKFLQEQVPDANLQEKLLPDYPIGCKRVLISDDYYPTLLRDNVALITESVERVEADAIITSDGERRPADVIIYGTGFRTNTFLENIEIQGLDGVRIADAWRDGVQAYRGVQVAGFPNFFMLYGPNTNLGHNSIIFMVEQQVKYTLKCLCILRKRPGSYLDVRDDAMRGFNQSIRERMAGTVWQGSCQSWYKTADGHVTNNWPSTTISFWWQLRRPKMSELELHPPQI